MKDFLWRMRTTALWFLAAMAIFTGVYLWWAYFNVHEPYDQGGVSCLEGISPIIISLLISFAFYLIYAKRYTYDEAYLYGESRKSAVGAATVGAVVYAVIFAMYALGLALLVRRDILSAPNMTVIFELYRISAAEIFFNFAYLIIINLLAYETANLLRKFRSWKFWVTAAVCIACLVILYYVARLSFEGHYEKWGFIFWKGAFTIFMPLLTIMITSDILTTRGRQYR